MVFVKKSDGSEGIPRLDILAARLKILEATYQPEPEEVTPPTGKPFVSDPNVNIFVEVVQNLVSPGQHVGERFYDRFKLKQGKQGEWFFAKFSKLGNLLLLHPKYGAEWFSDESSGFEESDLVGFEFIGPVEGKVDPKGNPIAGSTINWKGMRPLGVAEELEARNDKAKAYQGDLTRKDEEEMDEAIR